MKDWPRAIAPIGNDRDPQYLGDGVYVTWDGVQAWLSINPVVRPIAIEPQVLQALVDYCSKHGVRLRERALSGASGSGSGTSG